MVDILFALNLILFIVWPIYWIVQKKHAVNSGLIGKRILLSEQDFQTLISGGIVHTDEGVEIALKDIGYHQMEKLLDNQIKTFYANR